MVPIGREIVVVAEDTIGRDAFGVSIWRRTVGSSRRRGPEGGLGDASIRVRRRGPRLNCWRLNTCRRKVGVNLLEVVRQGGIGVGRHRTEKGTNGRHSGLQLLKLDLDGGRGDGRGRHNPDGLDMIQLQGLELGLVGVDLLGEGIDDALGFVGHGLELGLVGNLLLAPGDLALNARFQTRDLAFERLELDDLHLEVRNIGSELLVVGAEVLGVGKVVLGSLEEGNPL